MNFQGQENNGSTGTTGFGAVKRDEGQVFLSPGVHEVAITKVEYVTPETAKPYIAVTMESDAGITTQRFYVSPAAKEQSLTNLAHLFTKVVSDEKLNSLSWADDDWSGMCAVVSDAVCTGQALRIKLSGEEYNGRINAKFAFRPFAEIINQSPSKLVFNEASDVKREEASNLTSGIPSAGAMPQAPSIPQ